MTTVWWCRTPLQVLEDQARGWGVNVLAGGRRGAEGLARGELASFACLS